MHFFRRFGSLVSMITLLTLTVGALPAGLAHAEMTLTHLDTPNIMPLGTINALVAAPNGDVYVGGQFDTLGIAGKYGFQLSATTGDPVGVSPMPNNTLTAVISDREGGWYISGTFTQIEGYARNRIAHILSDGTVDPNFNPTIGSFANAMALSPDGSILYVGGGFSTVTSGVTRRGIAAFDTSNGATLSFDPNTGIGGSVLALALSSDGSTLYAGGSFTSVNGGTTRNRIAAFDTTTGTATSFDPNADGTVTALALTSDDSTLFAAGGFGLMFAGPGGAPQLLSHFAKLDTATGLQDPGFDRTIGANNSIKLALTHDDSFIFVIGPFSDLNNNAGTGQVLRNYIAKVDTTDGSVEAFDPGIADNLVNSVAVSVDDSVVYAGGVFTQVNANTVQVTRNRIAAFDAVTGEVTAFDQSLNNTVSALAVSEDGTKVYAGGAFTNNGTTDIDISHLARLKADGTWDESFDPDPSFTINAMVLTADGDTLYIGGAFTDLDNGNTLRNHVAAIDTSTGLATSFDPDLDGNVYSLALSSDESTLYIGGQFSNVNGTTPRNYLAAVDTTTGTATSFDPNLSREPFSLLLTADDATLYATGGFTTVNGGGVTRNYAAAFDTTTGTATAFDPNLDDWSYALAMNDAEDTVYIGGDYTSVAGGGTTRNHLAAFDPATGVATSWNPNLSDSVFTVLLSPDESEIFAGGQFQIVNGGTNRFNVGGFDTTTGTASSFDPFPGVIFGGLADVNVLAFSSGGTILTLGRANNINLAYENILRFQAPDTTAPVITILGDDPATVTQNTTYTDAGATAEDTVDGDLTGDIDVNDNVDTSTVGSYTVVYSVSDAADNTAYATRTVSVIAAPADDDGGNNGSHRHGGGGGGSSGSHQGTSTDEMARLEHLITILQQILAFLMGQTKTLPH